MKVRPAYQLPEDKQKKLERAKRLEWLTIFFMITIVTVMYLAMGSSQAMKAAWAEDLLSLVPPIAFLITAHFRQKPPNEKFPYGYHRTVSIAFLCAAIALATFGSFLFYDSISKLIKMEHPTIGMIELFGRQIWMGWIMMAALIYSAIPPLILGRMKLPLSTELHEKTLYTDAVMNKDDWLTALAGVVGIFGIGLGWWWADGVAAGIISFEVMKDGFGHLKEVIEDLIDKYPTKVGHDDKDMLPEQLQYRLQQLNWVADADVRLREEGDVLTVKSTSSPKLKPIYCKS
jgi:cation diffusion facilitator family transporter